MATDSDKPKNWDDVWAEERSRLGFDVANTKPQGVGLALSGGGIRSAVFCLGVIQYLAQHGWLRRFDYLSTVSGGGYIGAWLSTFLQRLDYPPDARGKGLPRVSQAQEQAIAKADSESIRYMRRFSNYLTPKTGLSRDLLSTVGIIVSNLLLSVLIVSGLLLALALAVLLAGSLFTGFLRHADATDHLIVWPFWGAILLAVMAMLCFTRPIQAILDMYRDHADGGAVAHADDPCEKVEDANALELKIGSVLLAFALLGLSAACAHLLYEAEVTQSSAARAHLIATGLLPLWGGVDGVWQAWALLFALAYLLINVPLIGASYFEMANAQPGHAGGSVPPGKRRAAVLMQALGVMIAGAVGGVVFYGASALVQAHAQLPAWSAVTFCVPLVVAVLLSVLTVHLMLFGRNLPTELREWWYRVFSTLLLIAAVWLLLFGAAVVGPALLRGDSIAWLVSALVAWLGSAGFAAIVALGKFAGKSGEPRLLTKLVPLAVWILVAGLLLGAFAAAFAVSGNEVGDDCARSFLQCVNGHAKTLSTLLVEPAHSRASWATFAVVAAVLLALNYWYNINVHSLNQLYRNRLVRCFLGATNKVHDERAPSGFDHKDDIAMRGLDKQRPLHIVCASLNLAGSRELAWQTRKALSFMFTPFSCGYVIPKPLKPKQSSAEANNGRPAQRASYFASSADYMRRPRLGEEAAVSLGSAMSISGAAASPNQGYHTNKGLAFLMALFNVRIGRWCPNPRAGAAAARRLDPRSGVSWFVAELMGLTNECKGFVYLSDGGHFDNMGLYELLRRRCAAIVVVDGEQDEDFKFDGLSEAVRKSRLDLNAEVDLDPTPIRPAGPARVSAISYALGAARYAEAPDHQAPLLYLKLSLPQAERAKLPVDVVGYAAANADFPHQSTGDQWFDEAQFESFCKLGYAIAEQACSDPRVRLALDSVSAQTVGV